MDKRAFLESLHQLGVRFSISLRNGTGGEEHIASPEELILLESDPVAGIAHLLGVTKAEYLGWVQDDHNVVCAGITAKGKRCKNIVHGGHAVSATRWASMTGSYCYVHGDL
jgi:hypothetical protein